MTELNVEVLNYHPVKNDAIGMMVMISGEAYPSIIQILLMNVLRGRSNNALFNINEPFKRIMRSK